VDQPAQDKKLVPDMEPAKAETTVPLYAAAGPALAHPIGSMIAGHYRVVEKLGTGGMGTVYKCEHAYLKLTVAVKVLNNRIIDDNSAVRRFSQEAQAAAAFDHAGIPAVREFGVDERGFPFLVMDFVDGELLSTRLKNSPLAVRDACRMAAQVCDALAHAHEKKIVHRDIKPSNIMLSTADGDMRAVLLDFGVAKVIDAVQEYNLTETGELLGTITYMSPEQAQGLAIDHRADIYALGCTLYEALAGTPPFTGSNRVEVMMKHQQAEPPDLPSSIPNELQQIVYRCLEKQPGKRYPSAVALQDELELFMQGGKRKTLFPRLKSKWKKSIFAAGVGIPSLALLSGLLWMAFHPQNELENLNRTISEHDSDSSAYFRRAMFYFSNGRRKVAVSDLVKSASLDPGQAKYHYWLARCYIDMWNPADALKSCARALELAPNYGAAYVARASAEAELGRYDEAVLDYRRAIAITGDTTESSTVALTNRSVAYRSLGMLKEALSEAKAAVTASPSDLDARLALVEALTGLGMYREAYDNFLYLDSFTERSSKLLWAKVGPELGLGKVQQALNDIKETASSSGMIRPMALLCRARIYLDRKRAPEALNDCNDALKQQPGNPVLHLYRGRALLDMNLVGEALQATDNALSIQPRYANALLVRSIALSRQGRDAESRQAYQAAHEPGMFALNDMGIPQDASVSERDPLLDSAAKVLLKPST
jgi:serine/threonine protein kinase